MLISGQQRPAGRIHTSSRFTSHRHQLLQGELYWSAFLKKLFTVCISNSVNWRVPQIIMIRWCSLSRWLYITLGIESFYLKFAFFWLFKGNQYEFLTHPKIKGLDGGLEPPTSGLPVHSSTTWANLTDFRMLLIAYMNVAMSFCDVINSIMMLLRVRVPRLTLWFSDA